MIKDNVPLPRPPLSLKNKIVRTDWLDEFLIRGANAEYGGAV
jgi:hypothetical protein